MAKLDIGDAVLSFVGDSSSLDASLASIAGKTQAALDPAAVSASNLAQTMVNTGQAGNSLADAIKLLPPPLQQSDQAMQDMAFSLRNVAPAADEATEATGRSMTGFQQARGEVMLFSEATGIHLPRAVTSFIAGLGPVQGVLQAAFAGTAVLFLLDVLVKAAEKIEDWSERADKVRLAWQKVDDTFFSSNQHIQNSIDQSSQKIIEMTQGPVAALDFALQHLAHTSDEVFKEIETAVDTVAAAMKQNFGNDAIISPFGKQAIDDLNKFKASLAETMRIAREAAPNDPFAEYAKGIDVVSTKIVALEAKIESMKKAGADDPGFIGPLQAEVKALDEVNHLLSQGVDLQRKKNKEITDQRAIAVASQEAETLKQSVDQQIANIEAWQASVHSAYLQGEKSVSDWKVAELQATQATAIAHEDYLQKLVTIYQHAGMVLKAQETAQELVTLRTKDSAKAAEELAAAEQKRHDVGQKIVEQNLQIVESGVDKSWARSVKAAEELSAAEDKLAKSEGALAKSQADTQVGYKEQEEAIKKLASFQLISEQQKDKQLQMLYAQEEKAALDALNNQLEREKQVYAQAFAALFDAQGKADAAQISTLGKTLLEKKTLIEKTESEIAKARDTFQKQELANDASFYAQTLELAIATGQKEAAVTLQNIHNSLLLAQAKLIEYRAHQQNTEAIKREIQEYQQEQREQVKLINGNKQVGQSIGDLAGVANQAYTSMAEAFAIATDAMIAKQKSFGQAMIAAVLDMLAEIAKHYEKIYIAKGIGNLADGNWSAAALDFAAAAAFGVVAGVLSGEASNIGQSKPSTSSSTAGTIPSDGGTNAGAGPAGGVNIPKLADGGLVMSPTLAMVGDAPGGEAVIPLHDSAALSSLAAAIAGKMPQNNNGNGALQIHLQSDIPLTVRKISKQVNKGQARLLSSNSIRVTRRSV